ncbi:MAG: hypothetical protein ACR2GO_08015 [Candidatus Limnocylindria bacterium]
MRRDPSQYRPDLRPMLILAALLVAIVVGWLVIGPLILPDPVPAAPGASLDGRWTRTPEAPLATTLTLDNSMYALSGDLAFNGSGRLAIDEDELSLMADPGCPDAIGRYQLELGDIDRYGLLPENRAQIMSLMLIEDDCADGARAATLVETWVLRTSRRGDVHGICDPPNEEAAITGHWPEPSGCSQP